MKLIIEAAVVGILVVIMGTLVSNIITQLGSGKQSSKDWNKNQSFPSGHIATIYTTYLLFESNPFIKYLYLLLLCVTGFCRVNLGDHHVSDCIFSLYICQISYHYLKYNYDH